jgi:hypothetical protein
MLLGVGQLVNFTPSKCLKRCINNQLLPFPLAPVISINRYLESKSKTCSFFLKRSIFQYNQAQYFHPATKTTPKK